MTAFSRVLPARVLDRYAILSLYETGDLNVLRKRVPVFCLEEMTGKPAPACDRNAAGLAAHPLSLAFLKRLPAPIYLFPYQNYEKLAAMARTHGWRVLANSPELRETVQERAFFDEMVPKLGLPRPPGDIVPMEAFLEGNYGKWRRRIGSELVFQLPDIHQGGGRGTFFVRCEKDYLNLRQLLKGRRHHGVFLKTVSIRRFLRGTPASVAVCATRGGTLVSAPQRQLMDLPYCRDFVEDGVFCGHAWGADGWSRAVSSATLDQASRIGDFLFRMGYNGIFGVDFVVHEKDHRVYPIEINPRLTAAFPMLSLLHINAGLIPLEAFHMLEFLDISHEMDSAALNRGYAHFVSGSHLLLFFPKGWTEKNPVPLRAGLYEFLPKPGKGRFLKETVEFSDIQNEHQFLLADGPVLRKEAFAQSHIRLCRMLFNHCVADESQNISNEALAAASWVLHKVVNEC